MAYRAKAVVTISWVGDGCGQMSVPGAQSYTFTTVLETMPGGDTVTAGNLNTLGTTLGTDIQTGLNANITAITNWATGGP